MYSLVIFLIILIAIFLILVVLAQNPKGGGLSSQFGGTGSTSLMGVKRTGDLLEQITWGLAIALLVLTLSTNFISESDNSANDGAISPNIDNARRNIQNTQQQFPAAPTLSDSAQEDLGLELIEGTSPEASQDTSN